MDINNRSFSDQYFSKFSHRKDRYSLRHIEMALAKTGDVHQKIPCIHVAGTNGKGSVCALLTRIFLDHGYKVGTYTSPHILSVRERIQLQAESISESRMSELVEKYETYFSDLSYFEVLTLVAFLFFYEEKVHFAVIETGLGGRLDATNVITPLVSIITSVSVDHKQHLGETVSEIAFEKAGIIKKGIPVVCAATQEDIVTIFRKRAQECEASSYFLGKDFHYEMTSFKYPQRNHLSYQGRLKKLFCQNLNLWNNFQPQNFSLVLAALEVLQTGFKFEDKLIQKSVKNFSWSARFEIIQKKPLIIYDVAHNPGGILELVSSLKKFFSWDKLYFLLSISKDKEWKNMLQICEGVTSNIGVSAYQDKRSWSLEEISQDYLKFNDLNEGFNFFCKQLKSHDILCITGSFHTIAEVRRIG